MWNLLHTSVPKGAICKQVCFLFQYCFLGAQSQEGNLVFDNHHKTLKPTVWISLDYVYSMFPALCFILIPSMRTRSDQCKKRGVGEGGGCHITFLFPFFLFFLFLGVVLSASRDLYFFKIDLWCIVLLSLSFLHCTKPFIDSSFLCRSHLQEHRSTIKYVANVILKA
jgi:hypothetical protein